MWLKAILMEITLLLIFLQKVSLNRKQIGARAIDSPKKLTNGVWLMYVTTLHGKKREPSVRFLGEPTVRKSAYALRCYLTFSLLKEVKPKNNITLYH